MAKLVQVGVTVSTVSKVWEGVETIVGLSISISITLAIVVDRWVSVSGDSWDTIASISSIETVVGLGLGLSISRALAIVVDRWVSVGGDSWETIGSIETIVGLGIGLSLTLAVVDSWDSIAIGMWDAIGTIETIVGLSLGISLALAVVDSWDSIAVGMWDAVGTIETIVGLGLGISITLAVVETVDTVDTGVASVGNGGDNWSDSLGSQVISSGNLLSRGVVGSHSTVRVGNQTGSGDDCRNSSVDQGGVSLSLGLTLAKSKRDAVKAIGGGDSLASQLVLLDGCALVEASLFLGSSVLRGDGTIGVVHQTGVLEGDLGNNTNSNIWNNSGTQQASSVQLWVSSGASASGGGKSHDRCDESLHVVAFW